MLAPEPLNGPFRARFVAIYPSELAIRPRSWDIVADTTTGWWFRHEVADRRRTLRVVRTDAGYMVSARCRNAAIWPRVTTFSRQKVVAVQPFVMPDAAKRLIEPSKSDPSSSVK